MAPMLIGFDCSAKLPIHAFLTAAFFPHNGALVMVVLYFTGILVGVLVALLAEDLARKTGLSAGGVASILKRLEEQGTITRTRSSQNRRKYLIELTPAGREAAGESERAVLASHKRILRALGKDDAQGLLRIVSRLCDLLQQ